MLVSLSIHLFLITYEQCWFCCDHSYVFLLLLGMILDSFLSHFYGLCLILIKWNSQYCVFVTMSLFEDGDGFVTLFYLMIIRFSYIYFDRSLLLFDIAEFWKYTLYSHSNPETCTFLHRGVCFRPKWSIVLLLIEIINMMYLNSILYVCFGNVCIDEMTAWLDFRTIFRW